MGRWDAGFRSPFLRFFLNNRDEGAWMDLDIIDMICIFFPTRVKMVLEQPIPSVLFHLLHSSRILLVSF